jgi:hypothetical protein
MATGRLAANDITAATNTTVYTVPADTYTVATLSLCNRGSATTTISVAVADADTPTNGEYIEFETELLAKNVLERTGLVLSADQRIVINSSEADVSAVLVGIETAA